MLESKVEDRLTKQVERLGGLCKKFTPFADNGYMDRIIFMPGGLMYLVETKAPGKVPRPLQLARHRQLTRLGFTVHIVDTIPKVLLFIDKLKQDQIEKQK